MQLRDGIFYVKDQSTPPAFHDTMRPALGGAGSVDYVSAHQGFTGPGGHPIELIDQLASLRILPEAWRDTHGEGDALFVVASEEDIERAWPRLLAGRPDFVKVFLVHSDEYAARRDNPELTPRDRGIDPQGARLYLASASKLAALWIAETPRAKIPDRYLEGRSTPGRAT
jgi:hypothetical protein